MVLHSKSTFDCRFHQHQSAPTNHWLIQFSFSLSLFLSTNAFTDSSLNKPLFIISVDSFKEHLHGLDGKIDCCSLSADHIKWCYYCHLLQRIFLKRSQETNEMYKCWFLDRQCNNELLLKLNWCAVREIIFWSFLLWIRFLIQNWIGLDFTFFVFYFIKALKIVPSGGRHYNYFKSVLKSIDVEGTLQRVIS